MQYAVITLKDKKILVDAKEVIFLDKFFKENKMPNFQEFNEEKDSIKNVVYGSILHNGKVEFIEHRKWLGFAFAYPSLEGYKSLSILDIHTLQTKNKGKLLFTPFAALIESDIELKITQNTGISAFLRYGNLDILTNVLNRECIYAIRATEKRKKFDNSNWKDCIDESRLLKTALSIS